MKYYHFALIALLLSSQAQADNVIWSGYKGNPGHSGFINTKTNPAKFKVLWTKSDWARGEYFSSSYETTATNHLLYFTVEIYDPISTGMYAVDPATGKTVWRTTLPDHTDISGAAYVDGKVLATQMRDDWPHTIDVLALDGNTGAVLYSNPTKISYISVFATPIIANNLMYTVDFDSVFKIDTNSGQIKWTTASGDGRWLHKPTASSKYIFHTTENNIDMISQEDGSSSQLEKPSNSYASDSVIVDEQSKTLYTSFVLDMHWSTEQLSAFDLETRQLKWSLVDHQERNIVAANGSLYYSDQNKVTEVNAVTGKIMWSWQAKQTSDIFDMLATPDILFVSMYDPVEPRVIAISRKTHEILWQINKVAYLSADYKRLYLNDKETLTAIALN